MLNYTLCDRLIWSAVRTAEALASEIRSYLSPKSANENLMCQVNRTAEFSEDDPRSPTSKAWKAWKVLKRQAVIVNLVLNLNVCL